MDSVPSDSRHWSMQKTQQYLKIARQIRNAATTTPTVRSEVRSETPSEKFDMKRLVEGVRASVVVHYHDLSLLSLGGTVVCLANVATYG
mmetsp:Transcript_40115/g.120974  ORF Transcript_40115/g.120974 Transcript_40115/m.120974 type:complete len:89 (+) Transcript_40115:395-661(+)